MNTFVQVLVKHGYSVLFASVFACQMGLPVAAILFLIAAGVPAGSGRLSLGVALGLAVIACLLALHKHHANDGDPVPRDAREIVLR
jgi:membrane protein DedA with SNARE-associated domain